VLAGDPERVAGQLSSALRPDVSRVIIRPHAPQGRSVAEVLRRFVTEVVPRVEAPVHTEAR
jgi:hypothetical protein